jgi:hypothetical protein
MVGWRLGEGLEIAGKNPEKFEENLKFIAGEQQSFPGYFMEFLKLRMNH